MDRGSRTALAVGGVVVFGLGLLLGFLLGRSGGEGELAEPATPTRDVVPTITPSQIVPTPSPGEAPAITTEGQVLQEGDRPVTSAPSNAPCVALLTPGTLGDCGEVPVAGGRVVWLVEQTTTPTGTPAFATRILSYVPDTGGWVEWLAAADPGGEQWSDVNVIAGDLTGDGVAELLVGFRETGEAETLAYDIVGYSASGIPEVLAHPGPAAKGAVVLSGGTIQEYAAQYPNDEPVCCPPSYLRRTIVHRDGFFRVVGSESVVVTAVPASQL